MKLIVHRGSQQIGGSCIELSSGNTRIILDAGLPLKPHDTELRPPVSGLFGSGGVAVNALFLSHAHADHSGLIAASRGEVPVWMTEGTSKMLLAGSLFAAQPSVPKARARILRDGKPVRVGPFSVEAFPVDHSVYGAAAFLIEAGGQRVLYTGDLRFHGRKPGMAVRLARAAKDVDAIIIEGTRLGGRASEANLSEDDLEAQLVEDIRGAPGLVLAMYSPMNVDRFTTFFRAARKSSRTLVVDPYQAFVLHLIHRQTKVPIVGGPSDLAVAIPLRFAQSRAGRRVGNKAWARPLSGAAITPAEIATEPQKFVVLYRSNMEPWLFPAGLPARTTCVYSYWPGYLTRDARLRAWAKAFRHNGGKLLVRHASGHGHPDDLRRFVATISPKLLIPVHTDAPEAWAKAWPNSMAAKDHQPLDLGNL